MNHTPLRNDADPDWQAIHQAADQQQSAFTQLLLAAFAALVAHTVLVQIRSALRFGNVNAAMQAVPVMDLLTLRPAVETTIGQVAIEGATIALEAAMVVRLGSSAGLPVAELAFWARQHAAALVVGITEQTRRALQETIVAAIQAGMSPSRAAPLIELVVGLNSVQARALWNRGLELRAEGKTVEQILTRLARYAAQLRKQRARVIARHELIRAANAGRRAQWQREVRDGLIVPDRWHREWVAIVPSDGRTCPYCEGQDGQHAPINGVYPDGSVGPPGHPLCRCTEVLRRVA